MIGGCASNMITVFVLTNIKYCSAIMYLMIDGDKKIVSKQPFASFPKVNSLQS